MPGSMRPFWRGLAVLAAGILWLTASACNASSTTINPSPTQPAGLSGAPTTAGTAVTTRVLVSEATLTTCDRSTVSTPATYLLACADGGVFLDALHWSAWNSPTATASGSLWENDCTPNCADGHYHSYPASVTVSALSGNRYTRMHVDAPRAPGGPFDYTIGPNGPQ